MSDVSLPADENLRNKRQERIREKSEMSDSRVERKTR